MCLLEILYWLYALTTSLSYERNLGAHQYHIITDFFNAFRMVWSIFSNPMSFNHFSWHEEGFFSSNHKKKNIASVKLYIISTNAEMLLLLFFSSHNRVEKEVQARMIADHLSTLHAEAPAMVAKENTKDLGNMYILLRTVPGGVTCLVKNLQEHIRQKGLQAVNNLRGDNVNIVLSILV